jgi:hypothetical protein
MLWPSVSGPFATTNSPPKLMEETMMRLTLLLLAAKEKLC